MTQLSEFSARFGSGAPVCEWAFVLGKSNSESRAPVWELSRFAGAPVCECLLYIESSKTV